MLMAKNVEDLTSVDFLPALRIGAQADSRIAKPILSTTGRTGIADDREKKIPPPRTRAPGRSKIESAAAGGRGFELRD